MIRLTVRFFMWIILVPAFRSKEYRIHLIVSPERRAKMAKGEITNLSVVFKEDRT
jgi:hypothetical protein